MGYPSLRAPVYSNNTWCFQSLAHILRSIFFVCSLCVCVALNWLVQALCTWAAYSIYNSILHTRKIWSQMRYYVVYEDHPRHRIGRRTSIVLIPAVPFSMGSSPYYWYGCWCCCQCIMALCVSVCICVFWYGRRCRCSRVGTHNKAASACVRISHTRYTSIIEKLFVCTLATLSMQGDTAVDATAAAAETCGCPWDLDGILCPCLWVVLCRGRWVSCGDYPVVGTVVILYRFDQKGTHWKIGW